MDLRLKRHANLEINPIEKHEREKEERKKNSNRINNPAQWGCHTPTENLGYHAASTAPQTARLLCQFQT